MHAAELTSEKLDLHSVTLVTITSVAIEATAKALAECLRHASFSAVLWCSDRPPPPQIANHVIWQRIEPITTRGAYSHFVLRELAALVQTEHALLVQWDGYVLDPTAWDDAFLDYDYIGAPWPQFGDGMDVGNGGFSLRSKRLLAATAAMPTTHESEDVAICRTWRPEFEQRLGLCFAPRTVAARFSYERSMTGEATFGFHGAFNLARHMPSKQVRTMLASVEPRILADSEIKEIFWKATRSGDVLLAAEMLRRKLIRWWGLGG